MTVGQTRIFNYDMCVDDVLIHQRISKTNTSTGKRIAKFVAVSNE